MTDETYFQAASKRRFDPRRRARVEREKALIRLEHLEHGIYDALVWVRDPTAFAILSGLLKGTPYEGKRKLSELLAQDRLYLGLHTHDTDVYERAERRLRRR